MRLFNIVNWVIWAVILGVLIFIFETNHKEPEQPTKYDNPIYVNLYIDSAFEEYEREAITTAALTWNNTTKNIVNYTIIQLPTTDKVDLTGLIIYKIGPDNPNIIMLDQSNDTIYLGYYERIDGVKTIALVGERIDIKEYKSVVLHELGHSLGLAHVDELGTLMYPYMNIMINGQMIPVNSNKITQIDLVQFCELYKCDPLKLQN